MRYLSSLIKIAIKWTPKTLVLWLVNFKLKGIAKLIDFEFDLGARKVYVKTQLDGELEAIEVWVENFAMLHDEQGYYLIIDQACANRPWLNHLLATVVGKPWQIPEMPQLTPYLGLAFELLKAENK
jgi:hypothetical protein